MLGVFIWFSEMPIPEIVKGYNVKMVYVGKEEERDG